MEQKQPKPKDALNGDHSAKSWFRIMWKNTYIQLVLLAIAFIVALFVMRHDFESTWGFIISLSIPIAMIAVITWLGFIKFWNELKGKS